MINITDQRCTGCRACELNCPMQCIHMKPDMYGFLVPEIDENLCSNCGLCNIVCPIEKPIIPELPAPIVYAAWLKDDQLLKLSASGGIFPALARLTFEDNGVVYGCALDEAFRAYQLRITDETNLWRLQGSKYVQSDTCQSFHMVQQDLLAGKNVLYSGTPCQIHGLKLYLGKEYKTLLTADLICHGVPSPAMFLDYISWLGRRHRSKIIEYRFREKSKYGWLAATKYTFLKKNRRIDIHASAFDDPYFYCFLKALISRMCCYTCQYTTTKRIGDFTLGDFWGIEVSHPDIPVQQGVSFLACNSTKSLLVLERLRKQIHIVDAEMEDAKKNHQLYTPVQWTSKRDMIMEAWRKNGFGRINRLYRRERGIRPCINMVARAVLNPKMRKRIKQILNLQ